MNENRVEATMSQHKYLYLTGSIALALAGVIAMFWLAGGSSPARASLASRYVATTGSDTSNSCTNSGSPCRTIQHAVDVADAGIASSSPRGCTPACKTTRSRQVIVSRRSVD
jgi:hypothetical protein